MDSRGRMKREERR